jgi:hypothetical protein
VVRRCLGGLEAARLPQVGDGIGWRSVLLARSAAKTGKSFCTYRFKFAGVVTALSDLSVGGPFPPRLTAQSCPGLILMTGEMPSSREGDRYILGRGFGSAEAQQLHPAVFPA